MKTAVTNQERLAKFEELKELINGSEADTFKNYWDGRFFTGDMTFIFDATPYNLYFYEGTMIDVKIAQPANGYYVGIKGTQEQWETFFQNPNFQLSISVSITRTHSSSSAARWPAGRISPWSRRLCV